MYVQVGLDTDLQTFQTKDRNNQLLEAREINEIQVKRSSVEAYEK